VEGKISKLFPVVKATDSAAFLNTLRCYLTVQAPPSNILPSGSKLLDMACETEFTKSELDGLHYQVEITSSTCYFLLLFAYISPPAISRLLIYRLLR